MKRFCYILLFLLGMQTAALSQQISNRGTDFWAAFGHHLQMEVRAWFPGDSLKLVFDFSAEHAAHVVVTIDGTTYKEEYDVPANSVLTSKRMPLPPAREPGSSYDTWLYTRTSNWPGGTNSEGVFKNKGIHITSNVPIVVFERIYFEYSSAATMLFPTDSWGYHYKCLAAPQNFVAGDGGAAGAFSYFYVIANQNNTKFRINPSAPSRSGLPANVPLDVVLQKGEVYQYLGAQKDASTMYSVTGTTITSVANSNGECLPFAAFVASSATSASCPGKPITGSLEHLLQQVFPQQAWGKRYFTIPTSPSGSFNTLNSNTFRVMVKDPATVVKRNGIALAGLTAEGTYEFTSNTADVIEADQPIQVAQYLPSQTNSCGYTGSGDPDYLILSPAEQGIKKASFMRTSVDHIDYNYLALTIPTAGVASLKIDGQYNNYSTVYAHPSYPGYSVVTRMWFVRSNTDKRPPAQCTVESDSAFNAFTYGLGQAETYMYNAGTYINNLSGYPFIKNQYNTSDTANLYTCAKTPVELSVLLRYKPTKIFWQLSRFGDSISPAADVTINAPVSVETVQINNLPYYRYRLPGTYKFNRPGVFTIPVFASEPTVEQCDHTELIPYQLEVRDTLQTDFSMRYSNCKASELVNFNGRSKFNDSSLIQRWEWTFNNGASRATASGQNVSYTFNAGSNSANLIAVDHVGCIADTTKSFILADKPATPDFKVTSGNTCVNNAIQFTEKNPQAGVQAWFWEFGQNDTTTLFTNGFTTSHAYASHTTITIRHAVQFSSNCYSDTAVLTVAIFDNPELSIDYPVGCLPANGIINFKSQVSTPDNQTAKTYLWNFGDPAATPANPNTSIVANPSHTYAAGNYPVRLQVTTNQGCKADSTFNISLQPRPALQYGPVLQPVCLNTAAPVSVAKATVTNGVAGTGIYKGIGTDSQGNFDPAIAKVGKHDIWYVFNGDNGCSDSAVASIWVHAVPAAAFTATADICLDQSATFTDKSTIDNTVDVTAKIQTWTWNFGDGNPDVIKTNGLPFNKNFAASKAFTISLTATSTDGCVSNLALDTVDVHALPVVDFDVPANICMPGGQALFTNKSTSGDTSSLVYLWNFGDGSTATDVNGSHTYTVVKAYTVNLKATSGFGCFKDSSKILPATAFRSKPAVPDFNITSTANCVNNSIVFTEKNPQAGAQSWFWDLGNADTSTLFSNGNTISHIYKQSDTLTVKHMVKFSDDCYSDTAIQTVIIYANPVLSITYPVGCLPIDGVINFTSKATTPENQSVRSYLWNFGDANATPANPNTSTIANPSHIYSAGNYNVSLKATTSFGCITDSVWGISLHPRPQINYGPVLQPVCFNAATVSVASASISNGITGTGVYKGLGSDAQGNFNPSVAGVGNQSMWYVFSSDNGCTDSAMASIWVHAVPTAAFTTATDICLDASATFTDQSNIDNSVDQAAKIQTWTWNFGDGNADVVNNNGQPFAKSFNTANSYTITLKATSNNGCISNTATKMLSVHAMPVADFSLPSSICMPGGQAVFTNNSKISEPGQLSYSWDFGDGGTATTSNGTHVYNSAQDYTINLKAVSAFGCSHDTSKLLPAASFKDAPVAAFTASNITPCEKSVVDFTDQSTSSGNIASWQWNFGDGTTSTSQSPSKTYTKFGNYTATLTVTDANGCSSAPLNASQAIRVLISPVIDAGPNITADENASVTFKATAQNASELIFSWAPAGLLSNPTSLNPGYIVTQGQVFALTATDKDGACSATDDMKVTMLRPVVVPNAFSPNGDGINDVWNIPNLADYPNAWVRIFDRYGRLVFNSTGYSKPWDGTRNGTPMPVATYYYIIQVKQGETPLNGSVTIIR